MSQTEEELIDYDFDDIEDSSDLKTNKLVETQGSASTLASTAEDEIVDELSPLPSATMVIDVDQDNSLETAVKKLHMGEPLATTPETYLRAKLTAVQNNLIAVQDQAIETATELETVKKDRDLIMEQLDKTVTKYTAAKNKVVELEHRCKHLTGRRDHHKKQCDTFQSRLKEAEAKLTVTTGSTPPEGADAMVNNEEQVFRLKERIDSLNEQLTNAWRNVNTLQEELDYANQASWIRAQGKDQSGTPPTDRDERKTFFLKKAREEELSNLQKVVAGINLQSGITASTPLTKDNIGIAALTGAQIGGYLAQQKDFGKANRAQKKNNRNNRMRGNRYGQREYDDHRGEWDPRPSNRGRPNYSSSGGRYSRERN
ncbi:hypothetical protein BCR33DRAFT_478386 [Rhizoclosmatium globosum]|uniref:Uncharacterized protein n=1 Tax=Rhizoclosmatium globosum TaxID=329046 RepID=A0A1Y2BQV1_9FUNG|nr:hypothetical protein BCR33DRAFT_478386 [Rhizoclosmatium globosum]|eukprot:ORY36535.1 hypothetical protein BCR33DRAFT_478386 [Rhizoclosmatium globosum]